MDNPSIPTADGNLLFLYLKSIGRYSPLSAREEIALAARIREGDRDALTRLVRANLRFVVNVAKNYQNQGLPLSDLINEGNLGLIRAAKRFDGKKNFKFITYAVWWIRQAILKALADQSRCVKLPLNRVGTLYKIGQARVALEQKYGRIPTPAEIGRTLDLSESEVLATIRSGAGAVSFDSPLQKGDDFTIADLLADESGETPEESYEKVTLTSTIRSLIDGLSEREQTIIRLYFGIDGQKPCTLEEIGDHLKLTRERTRQLKQRALNRLKQLFSEKRLMVLRP